MNDDAIDKIAQAVLYEGYMLYPYRRCTKNTQRWTFGCLYPQSYSGAVRGLEPASMQVQCLLRASVSSKLRVTVKFLQPVDRSVGRLTDDSFAPVDELEIDGTRHQSWQEAIERTATAELDLSVPSARATISFPGESRIERIREPFAIVRTREDIEGAIDLCATPHSDGVFQITLKITNMTPLKGASTSRESAQMYAFASTHAVLRVDGGAFVSAIDPPAELVAATRELKQIGAWPVLVGDAGQTDAMLAAPIILYDFPQIAPESAGDLFDGTEIDEILSLRVMTLSDEEKRAVASLDPRSAEMLRRTETMAREQLTRLHGTMRQPRKSETLHVGDRELRTGDRVQLRPRPTGADAFDIILRGKTATIVAIEQDYENKLHVAVTIDDDPGADIGAAGKIGHRFFYRPDEIEPLRSESEATA